jgi:hypothetical protein
MVTIIQWVALIVAPVLLFLGIAAAIFIEPRNSGKRRSF